MSLLPALVHVRGVERLSVLVRLVGEEASERRSGRDLVLTRLVEVLLIEALRSTPGEDAPPGLLRGLADARLAPAMRQMHGQLARSWTVAQLAKTAALSRSAFFERFTRTVGLPPMEYLLAWRMAVAKDLLRRHDLGLAEVAERVGYGSASTFSTAFSRHVGQPPGRYARERSQHDTISRVNSNRHPERRQSSSQRRPGSGGAVPDWDISSAEQRTAWAKGEKARFYPYGKAQAQVLAETRTNPILHHWRST